MTPLRFHAGERRYAVELTPNESPCSVEVRGGALIFGIAHSFVDDGQPRIAALDARRHVLRHGVVSIYRGAELWSRVVADAIPSGDGYLDLTVGGAATYFPGEISVGWEFVDLPGSPWAPEREVLWLPRLRVVAPVGWSRDAVAETPTEAAPEGADGGGCGWD